MNKLLMFSIGAVGLYIVSHIVKSSATNQAATVQNDFEKELYRQRQNLYRKFGCRMSPDVRKAFEGWATN